MRGWKRVLGGQHNGKSTGSGVRGPGIEPDRTTTFCTAPGVGGSGEEMLSWPRGASALPSPFGGWDSSPHGGFHEIFYTNHLFEDLNEYKFCSD